MGTLVTVCSAGSRAPRGWEGRRGPGTRRQGRGARVPPSGCRGPRRRLTPPDDTPAPSRSIGPEATQARGSRQRGCHGSSSRRTHHRRESGTWPRREPTPASAIPLRGAGGVAWTVVEAPQIDPSYVTGTLAFDVDQRQLASWACARATTSEITAFSVSGPSIEPGGNET
jgi:hypothetical protein